jgi:hypothetical protein
MFLVGLLFVGLMLLVFGLWLACGEAAACASNSLERASDFLFLSTASLTYQVEKE